MKRKIELLAPGGDVDSIKAAIIAGADAVYCGLDRFNARNSAVNISFDDLQGILRLAHKNNCQVFLTLNIIIVESEIPALINLLNKLVNTTLDGIIVQDLGVLYLLKNHFKSLKIHASTQFTTHNEGQIHFLSKLGATRVNLSRELTIHEIKSLTLAAHERDVLVEVFVHGSSCISFSGICYMSSVHGGNSGNRGRCSQPCRDQYITTSIGNHFPLNLKDNSAFFDLKELSDAGVDSLKIEGRIKKFHYVHTVVNAWREQLQKFYNGSRLSENNSALYKVFNRDFSNAFLTGAISRNLFIDNPRDHSAIHLAKTYGALTTQNLERAKKELYDEKTEMIASIQNRIDRLSIAKASLSLFIEGQLGSVMKVTVITPDASFEFFSEAKLTGVGKQELNKELVLKSFKALNDTEYYIDRVDLENLQKNLFIPFKEFNSLKKRILFQLNGLKKMVDPIDVPVLKSKPNGSIKPTLSILISSPTDLYLCNETSADIYYQLPNGLHDKCKELIDLFRKNKTLIPWFPSVLIGNNYRAAVEFIRQVQPTLIVTNNTGIAYHACEKGIAWIAGPYLNVVNSFSLLCLKENFNCSGAFISNEINKQQIKSIKKPERFNLYYSIYHPIMLMTSRQCLFHPIIGCEKETIDDACIAHCEKSTNLTNLKNVKLQINKTKGNYHCIYNETHYLNTDIQQEIPDLFSSFFIDLTDILTETRLEMDKLEIVKLFESHVEAKPNAAQELKRHIHPTTHAQYKKGI